MNLPTAGIDLRSGTNNRYLLIAITAMTVQFFLFKRLYPYPDFFTDTYYYISTAASHGDYDIWPIGYSKFLEYFSFFTHNALVLVAFQYIFIELSCLYFFFTLRELYHPGKEITNYLFFFLLFDPLALYIGNYITTDALFWGLTLIWFSLLLKALQRPGWKLIILQGILLAILFPVRYTAFYYPLILIPGIWLSRNTLIIKVAGILLPCLLILLFGIYMRTVTYKATGVRAFSSFSGWQLANNALYMYPHVKTDSTQFFSSEARELDQVVRGYFDTVQAIKANISPRDGAFYIWNYRSPLGMYAKQYIHQKGWSMGQDYLRAWGQLAPQFSAYGKSLILQHPWAYLRYYVLPNTGGYFYPPLESLSIYDGGTQHIYPDAKEWFHYDSLHVYSFNDSFQLLLLGSFPLLFLVANLFFVFSAFWYWKSHRIRQNAALSKGLLLVAIFLLINFGFSVLAAPIVFRYQVCPFILCVSFALLVYDWQGSRSQHN